MPRAARTQLSASATAGMMVYTWPTPIAVVAWAHVQARTAAEALVAAIGGACAGLPPDAVPPPAGRAIVVGSRTAAYRETLQFAAEIESLGPALVNPALFPPTVMNAAAGIAAIEHRCEGPNVTVTDGVQSALDALVQGADLVAGGRADIAFVGGFETDVDVVGERSIAACQSAALIAVLMTGHRAAASGLRVQARLVATACAAFLAGDPIDVESLTVGVAAAAASRAVGGSPEQLATERIWTAAAALPALARVLTRLSQTDMPTLLPLFASSIDQPRGTALVVTGGTVV